MAQKNFMSACALTKEELENVNGGRYHLRFVPIRRTKK